MSRIFVLILTAVMLLTGCNKKDAQSVMTSAMEATSTLPEQEPADNPQGFTVSGTKLLDANGNEFIMRGVNHPHSWYAKQDETALQAIAQTGANTVRIVCGSGQQYTRETTEGLRALIERCRELGMIAVLEVHDITGKDDIASLEKTVDFWIDVKDAFIGNEAYAILNIANEWVGKWDGKTWRDGYCAAIPRLRSAGIRNTIIVDAAGWGQFGQSIADYGAEVLAADPDGNTMFSVHMYGTAGKNEKTIRKNLLGAAEKGLCIIVGEFGYTHSDGDVDEEYIMSYCEESGIGWLGWSWKGNSGGVEYLDIANEWDGSVLSQEWGEKLVNGANGIRATSRRCSVFGE